MADCSKTLEFFAEMKRLCDSESSDGLCGDTCPFYELNCPFYELDCPFSADIAQDYISILQKWSDEHPEPKPKTYADDFFEKFPEAIRIDGKPVSCRANLYRTSCRWKSCNNVDQCAKDCLSCWNEVMPE